MSMRSDQRADLQSPWLNRLFVGGCTLAYVALIGAVGVALKIYGG